MLFRLRLVSCVYSDVCGRTKLLACRLQAVCKAARVRCYNLVRGDGACECAV